MSRWLAAALFAFTAGSTLVSCSSSLSVEDYADRANAAADAYVTESQSLSSTYQSTVEDGVRAIAASGDADVLDQATDLVTRETVGYLAVLSDTMARYVDALRSLTPPGEIEDAHDAHVAAIDAVLRAIPDTRRAVEAADDLDAIQLALTTSGFADGQTRWTVTCSALEQAVRDLGRGLDLGCTRPTEPG